MQFFQWFADDWISQMSLNNIHKLNVLYMDSLPGLNK